MRSTNGCRDCDELSVEHHHPTTHSAQVPATHALRNRVAVHTAVLLLDIVAQRYSRCIAAPVAHFGYEKAHFDVEWAGVLRGLDRAQQPLMNIAVLVRQDQEIRVSMPCMSPLKSRK